MEPTTSGKWLELLKEIAPNIKRAGLLFNAKTAPFANYWLRPFDNAAKSLGCSRLPREWTLKPTLKPFSPPRREVPTVASLSCQMAF